LLKVGLVVFWWIVAGSGMSETMTVKVIWPPKRQSASITLRYPSHHSRTLIAGVWIIPSGVVFGKSMANSNVPDETQRGNLLLFGTLTINWSSYGLRFVEALDRLRRFSSHHGVAKSSVATKCVASKTARVSSAYPEIFNGISRNRRSLVAG